MSHAVEIDESAPQHTWAHADTHPAPNGHQAREDVKSVLTAKCSHCDKPIAPNSTGLCRSCWLDPAVRPRKRFARSEAPDQIANAMHLMAIAAESAKSSDPGMGLAQMIDALAQMQQLVNDAGVEITKTYGSSVVAGELNWSKQRVDDRWGPGSKNYK